MKPSDEELAKRAAAGNRGAGDELLERYKETARAKARLYRILGGDADDLMQEGMIGLFNAIANYDPEKGASFKTFANLCISRRILTAVKASGRRRNAPLNESFSLDLPMGEDSTLGDVFPAGADSDPEELLILRETLESLTDPESKVFSALERDVISGLLQGKNYRSVASDLGRSPKSVDNAVRRIRRKLKAFL